MEIQDITIWSKGETKTATQIKVALTGDDLSSKAVFYYELLTADNIQLIGGTAGDIIFRDGGASGTVLVQFNIPANTNNSVPILIPAAGLLFETNLHVTLPTSAKVTIFYGK